MLKCCRYVKRSVCILPFIAFVPSLRRGWHYMYKHALQSYDWFVKADDDTYFNVKNLRFALEKYNTTDPLYLGGANYAKNETWAAGGAGYIFSRATLAAFVGEQ